MKKKKITVSVISALLLIGSVFSIASSASFGSGVAVVASEAKIIKTGIYGQKIVFSDLDFKQGLAITDFDKIEIKKIPLSVTKEKYAMYVRAPLALKLAKHAVKPL